MNAINFSSLGLTHDLLLSAIQEYGYTSPTPVQSLTIPKILEGLNVVGQAQTGTGKTGAFVLPLLQKIMLMPKNKKPHSPRILVLTPTRELTLQVANSFRTFSKLMNVDVATIYGGQDYIRQNNDLKKGVQIIAGTVGRLIDHINKGKLKLDSLEFLILDEADEMLRMGFIEDIKFILSTITNNQCQKLLFSATLPKEVNKVIEEHIPRACKVAINSKNVTSDTIEQKFLVVKNISKQQVLERLLETLDGQGMIIFVNNKSSTVNITDELRNQGYLVSLINGDMKQNDREQTIRKMKNATVDILIATDVAARGLDIDRISHVINFDLPKDKDIYTHRIGRTGRAGKTGQAISLIYPSEVRQLMNFQRLLRKKIEEINVPSIKSVNEKKSQNFKEEILNIISKEDLSNFEEIFNILSNQGEDFKKIILALICKIHSNKPIFLKEKLLNKKIDFKYYKNKKREYSSFQRNKSRVTNRQKSFQKRKKVQL